MLWWIGVLRAAVGRIQSLHEEEAVRTLVTLKNFKASFDPESRP
jgi:hypothetical protein